MARSELKAPNQSLDDFLGAATWQRVCGREGGLTSPAWDEVPRHRHQVLVCQGPRCLARGAGEVTTTLQRLLAESSLGDDEGVAHLCRAEPPAQGRSVQYRLRRARGATELAES